MDFTIYYKTTVKSKYDNDEAEMYFYVENKTNKTMTTIIQEITNRSAVAFSGPNIASEMVKNLSASTTIACEDENYLNKVKNVVLGCTHYPLIQDEIKEVLGDVRFFNGAPNLANHLKDILEVIDLH